jgi:hypothetical protein
MPVLMVEGTAETRAADLMAGMVEDCTHGRCHVPRFVPPLTVARSTEVGKSELGRRTTSAARREHGVP